MIEINYSTRLGNKLFQYALGRILSSELDLYLPACPINGFPSTNNHVPGQRYDNPSIVLTGQDFDLQRLLSDKPKCHILLDGNFQQSILYLPWADVLRSKWLVPEVPNDFVGASANNLVIHIRRTDYLWQGWGLPFSTYQSIIESQDYDQVVIVTDDPHDPFFWRFHKYKPIIRHTTVFNDFLFLRSATNLMLSPSSFSWWAAFLSNASRIYFPVPKAGIWAVNHGEGVNLEIADDNRYEKIYANETLSLNFFERLYFEKLFWRLKYKNLGPTGYLQSFGSSLINRLISS